MGDSPWVMRTYSGHSTPKASNELYRSNLAKGQTGLSIAFDLPTQIGYDPDAPQAQGEVGKVGVPVAHIGHMAQLLDEIPLAKMNTSMTINATAAWLFGLYVAHAQAIGVDPTLLSGTTQNDIIKEYLSRGTYIFPPQDSLRLTVDMIVYALKNVPKWNPINVCSYHLQEAGATPMQEIAFALATAIGVLDSVRESGKVEAEDFPQVVGRISFFVNSGIRFIEETCKMRAFTKLWDSICKERYGVSEAKLRRFRYGVQVNSLGLTEVQPENNVARIVLEALGVTLSKNARARAIQLPTWNEALGLPRPWDQQWSLRIQQILAFESDLLEYDDIFEGSKVIERKTRDLVESSQAELKEILDLGGAFEAIDELKTRLVASQTERIRKIESGELKVIGVNCFEETAQSRLMVNEGVSGESEEVVLRVDPQIEKLLIEDVQTWRRNRDNSLVAKCIEDLKRAASAGDNLMISTIALAKAGGTTGEWAQALRDLFGEYRGPTGIGGGTRVQVGVIGDLATLSKSLPGGPPKLLLAKPGLDGHSNGAEQIAVAARDCGFEVVYQGIRLTPDQIASCAVEEDPDIIGLSILSGSHLELVPQVITKVRSAGISAPIVVGGIIPAADQVVLIDQGVESIYTPKDFEIGHILEDMYQLAAKHRSARTTF